jgi:hypothetical protein
VSVSKRSTKPEQSCRRFRISNNMANLGLVFATKNDPNWPFSGRKEIIFCDCVRLGTVSNFEALNQSL